MIDFSTISNACVKCGKCIPYCTIYRVHREEVTSPRGYLDLVGAYSRGDLSLDKLAKDFFESCFLCTTCVEVCPSSLGVDQAIEKVRIDIAQKYGIAWYKRAYFFLLRHRRLMDFVFSMVAFVAPCAFKREDGGNKIWFSKRVVFPFLKKSFISSYKGLNAASAPKAQNLAHHKVAIFIGCLANYNYKGVGEGLLKILDRLGIDALVPKQECCGAPAFFTGDIKSVNTLIKRNIEYFESFIDEVDAILIPEATCAAMLMSDWEHALEYDDEASEYLARLKALKPKMAMASHWLYHNTNLAEVLESKGGESKNVDSNVLDSGASNSATKLKSKALMDSLITYHDPCHAKKVLKIHKEPRALLAKNHRLIEMSESDRCCGFGGVSMQSDRYALTLKAGAPKAKMIADTRANIVSAECSACRMQITNSLSHAGVNAKFAHPLELIAKALD
ncbi:glycerol-3-phosphate dehydrogenase [Helicobacter sp. CLO-3]|uniref:(Fe-S)-binding protein n=1 Tax=unclassified Helicobacter TaxID=2593540 RepID=UPI00080550FA|nr:MULTISPECIES: (Fe-S)-binding protein [unclassified Helicobacter]OBV30126.1 glycerol-3-phosphate dehydrogenase [Helicobacter sp. CLO-3]OHU83530.1 glycerol-3-phosphate dehydrogenase [Helicobacter sp. CLO-3]